jgi:histidinol phosphatase-like enzyme
VVFDFDGVIHSYVSGWKSAEIIPDEPVDGIKEAIAEIRKAGYEVAVVSSRAASEEGKGAIQAYLEKYGIRVDDITSVKLPAICYIDDRAICFNGDPASLLRQIRSFRPWNKR